LENKKTIALVLAGYDKPDFITKLRRMKELRQSYDGEIIYMGRNKFLEKIGDKVCLQYVIDAIQSSRKGAGPIYDRIYLYNDVRSVQDALDMKKYPELILKQMKGSVGANLKDFYFNEITYGDRVDIFFGDTPRITPEDVQWIHDQYSGILENKTDHRGVKIRIAFGLVKFDDLTDDWLSYRHRYIKHGKNKGKLKYFVGFENFQARIGNSGSMIKHSSLDEIVDLEAVNLFYNIRKALSPRIFSKIIYLLMKTKNYDLIKQVKKRSIKEETFADSMLGVISSVYNIDVSDLAGYLFKISRNAAHWENDIDTPTDLKLITKRLLM
jgi:hypothetical protein